MKKDSLFQRTHLGISIYSIVLLALCSLGINARAQFVLNQIWSISPGDANYPYINTDGTQRGIAYNPATHHVLVVSRTGGNSVHILDADTGADTGTMLDLTGVSGGGGGAVNLVDVADDGTIYVCNLATGAGTFKIYQWTSEAAVPTVVFGPADPALGDTNAPVTNSKRFGDNFTVRGSGIDTRILVNSRGGRVSALLFPTDSTVTAFTSQTIHTDVNNGDMGLGVAFGAGNTYWTKAPSRNLRHLEIDMSFFGDPVFSLSAVTLANIAITPTSTSGLAVDTNRNLLAIVDYTTPTPSTDLYDISTPSTPVLKDSRPFPVANANGNGTGTADFGTNQLFALASNNGIPAYEIVAVTAPVIGSGPTDETILEGGYGSLRVNANGTEPLIYFWRQGTTVVSIQTNNPVLSFTNVSLSAAGTYSVIVSNASGTATSTNATLTIQPAVLSSKMTPLWSLKPGDRPYLAADGNQRGIAYNPVNNHLLVVSRTPSPAIRVLNATDGTDLHSLDMTGVGGQLGETFPINLAGVTDDGVVYACNLSGTGDGAGFTIYRWADDEPTTVPTVAYGPLAPTGNRIGDVMDVRGSDIDLTTQVLCPARQNNSVVIFSINFDNLLVPTLLSVADTPSGTGGFAGLGAAFGSGNTFWAKAASFPVSHVAFDLLNGVANVTATYFPSTTSTFSNTTVIDFDAANDFLGAIAFNETPDNLQLFDMGHLSTTGPVLIDQDFFPADNDNSNGTGAIAFDPAGGRVFALESNNGIIALNIVARLKQSRSGNNITLSWTGPSVLQSATDVAGPYSDVMGAASGYTEVMTDNKFFRLRR